MIEVKLSRADFEYDIHSLVRAFYPETEVRVFVEGSFSEDTLFTLNITLGEKQIGIVLDREMKAYLSDSVALNSDDRKTTKNALKNLLYRMLSDFSGQTLPWGNLTGIRPTKIPAALLTQGSSVEYAVSYMKKTYGVSEAKAELCVAIAKRELDILKNVDYRRGYSIYIGIPFCPSTCLYCSFTSYPVSLWERRMDEYLDALCIELDFVQKAYSHRKLNTVYIGGGTPTTLWPEQLERLLVALKDRFSYADLQELTVEAGRPDSITEEKLRVLRKHEVSRISINPQTMRQETLDLIGRHHTVDQTIEAFLMARSLGFENINMDLIVGLPGETIEDVRHTMEELKKLGPDSITVHSLALKRASRLNMNWDQYKDMEIHNTQEIMEMTAAYAGDMGMNPYYLYRQKNMAGNFENVGYAKEGKAGIYNILIMEEIQTILAAGAGAATKIVLDEGSRIERVENIKDPGLYLERIEEMVERKRKCVALYEK